MLFPKHTHILSRCINWGLKKRSYFSNLGMSTEKSQSKGDWFSETLSLDRWAAHQITHRALLFESLSLKCWSINGSLQGHAVTHCAKEWNSRFLDVLWHDHTAIPYPIDRVIWGVISEILLLWQSGRFGTSICWEKAALTWGISPERHQGATPDVPAHPRGVRNRCSSRSFPNQTILWLYGIIGHEMQFMEL